MNKAKLRKKQQVNRELSAEEEAMNIQVVKSLKRNKKIPPTLMSVTADQLLSPHSKAILHTGPKRDRIMKADADKWPVKVTDSQDRQDFPELTVSGDTLTDAKQLGRLINTRCELDAARLAQLRASQFGIKLTQRVMDAVWGQDGQFLIDLGTALRWAARSSRKYQCRKIYRFILEHPAEIEQCRTRADAYRLVISHGLSYDRSSFYRICRNNGLLVGKG